MKKTVLIMLIISLFVFAGCAKSSDDALPDDDTNAAAQKADDTQDGQIDADTGEEGGKTENEEENADNPPDYKIDESWFSLLGESVASVGAKKGAVTESIWENGPLYRFGGERVWYAFSEYDFDENNSYVALGNCTQVIVPLSELLGGASPCDAASLEDATGRVLSSAADDMDGGYVFSTAYKGYELVIYEMSADNINADTMVTIQKGE